LEQGLLPYDSSPRVWGASGNGETCDACELVVEPPEMVIEGITLTDGNRPLHVHDRRRPLQRPRHVLLPLGRGATQLSCWRLRERLPGRPLGGSQALPPTTE
jgi:hypothetical protein